MRGVFGVSKIQIQKQITTKFMRIFRLCGITRIVTVLNSATGNEEKRPINEVVSSNMARRTFAGNLYKKVKDHNLIASMTGHKPGSTAFARYRNIDMDIKTEMIDLLNEQNCT